MRARERLLTDTEREEDGDAYVELESGRARPFAEHEYELGIESDAEGVEQGVQRGKGV